MGGCGYIDVLVSPLGIPTACFYFFPLVLVVVTLSQYSILEAPQEVLTLGIAFVGHGGFWEHARGQIGESLSCVLPCFEKRTHGRELGYK